MKTETRIREFKEGWQGRQCPNKFSVDTLAPLPEPERICPACRDNNLAIMVANDVGNWDSFKENKNG